MLTPEREKEIRYFNLGNAPWECQSWMSPAINELFAEIDRLRAENKKLLDQEIEPYEKWRIRVIEQDQLREKLAVAEKKISRSLEILMMGIPYGAEKGPIVNDVNDLLHEALAKIR